MIGNCPGSPFVPASSAPTAIQPGYPLLCQIFTPSTWFSSMGRERSHRGLNLAIEGVGDDNHDFGGQKLLHSRSDVYWCTVIMEHPVVHAHFVQPLLPHVLPLHLNTSWYDFALIVWPGGTNSLWIILLIIKKTALSLVTYCTTKVLEVHSFYQWGEDMLPWSKCDFSTHITEVIQTVHTLTGNFYPIWNKGWEKGVSYHEQCTCRIGNTTDKHPKRLLPLHGRRVYDNVSLSCSTENVPQNVVAHHLGAKHSTHLLSSKLLLWDSFCNLQTRANSQFLMSFSCSAPQN
jgi:hypothetical protein